MSSIVDKLISKELITPPRFLKNSIQYEAITGSVAYGVSTDNSDMDIYGFCIPPKEIIFPHLAGVIQGFDKNNERFDQYQQHHILDKGAKKEYDITIYNIVKYFRLCAGGNPNMIDSLFVPRRCVLHSTMISEMVRERRHLFLSKKCWTTHKGYAFSQISKMQNKNSLGMRLRAFENTHNLSHIVTYNECWKNSPNFNEILHNEWNGYKKDLKKLSETPSNRHQQIRELGFDRKFAYHTIRLLNQVEQILTEHDLDLERNKEQLKSIRKGEWSKEQILDYFDRKEKSLEEVYIKSDLRRKPAEAKIKILLLECLEQYFGSLDKMIRVEKSCDMLVADIEDVLEKYKGEK